MKGIWYNDIKFILEGDMLNEKVKEYFQNPRKIQKIETDEEYNLILFFDNGEKKRYPMKERLTGVFEVLKDRRKFVSVFIDEFGNPAWDIDEKTDSSIHWENRIDLCKDALYLESEPVE